MSHIQCEIEILRAWFTPGSVMHRICLAYRIHSDNQQCHAIFIFKRIQIVSGGLEMHKNHERATVRSAFKIQWDYTNLLGHICTGFCESESISVFSIFSAT